MVTFITVVHVLIALLLILVTFIQDSKSDSGGVFGGSSSQSILGPVGAATVLQKMTWSLAAVFAVTSIALAYVSSHQSRSILDSLPQAPLSLPANSSSTGTEAAMDPTSVKAEKAEASAEKTEESKETPSTQ